MPLVCINQPSEATVVSLTSKDKEVNSSSKENVLIDHTKQMEGSDKCKYCNKQVDFYLVLLGNSAFGFIPLTFLTENYFTIDKLPNRELLISN